MLSTKWSFAFSLVSLVSTASVIQDSHRVNSTKPKHKTLLPGDSELLNDISDNSEEIFGNTFIPSEIGLTNVFNPGRTPSASALSSETSSYATGYQKPSILTKERRNSVFQSASEPLPVAITALHNEKNDPQLLPRVSALERILASDFLLENPSIQHQLAIGQIDGSSFGSIAEERQSRPNRRPPRPLFSGQRPRRRPFFRATSSTLVPPPPARPTSPVANPPVPSVPLINTPDISSIPLQSSGDSGSNDILVERFPPFDDEPFPPFNDASFDQPLAQLTTQEEPLLVTREISASLGHQSSRPQTQSIPQVSSQQITPLPQSTPQLPLQQLISVLQTTTQLPLQQTSIPQAVQLPPVQQNTPVPQPLPQVPFQQSTPLPQQETTTLAPLQLDLLTLVTNQPPSQVGNQPLASHTSQRQPHHLQVSPESHRISQQFPQSIPQPVSQNQLQKIPHIRNEHIPQLLPPQEPALPFQPLNQPFQQTILRPQQQLQPPPPIRIPQQGLQRFLAPPQQQPSQTRPQRGAGRQVQSLSLRNTRQPRFAAQTRWPRRLERQNQAIEQRRPRFGRDSAFSSVWAAIQSVFEPSRSRTTSPRGSRFRF